MANPGHTETASDAIYAVSPNIAQVGASQYAVYEQKKLNTSLSPYEVLYTRFGYGKSIVSKTLAAKLSLNCGTFTDAGSVFFVFGYKDDSDFTSKLSCLIDASDIPGTLITSFQQAPKT